MSNNRSVNTFFMIIHNYLAKNIDIFAAEIWNQVSPSVDNFKEGEVHKVTIKLLHSKKG